MWLEVCAPEQARAGWAPVLLVAEPLRDSGNSDRDSNARRDDAATLHGLYCRDLRMLLALVRRVVRSPSDAEDIVQDAFLRVWRAMSLGAVRSPRAVLFKTAYNLALNHLRRPRNHRLDTAEGFDEPTHDAPTAEEQMIQDEDLEACRQAFARLPLRCRETLTLRVVDELSYKEMSVRLGLSVSTLEKHYIRGRRLCRDLISAGSGEIPSAPMRLAAE